MRAQVSICAIFDMTEVVPYKAGAVVAGALSFPTHSAVKLRNGWCTQFLYSDRKGWRA